MLSESLGLPRVPLRGPFVNGPYQGPEPGSQGPVLWNQPRTRNIFLGRQTATAKSTHRGVVVVEIHVFGELPEQRE